MSDPVVNADDIRERVAPVTCARGHDSVTMYEKRSTIDKVRYKCPTCNRELLYAATVTGLRQTEEVESDLV
jgi:transposase-like protein